MDDESVALAEDLNEGRVSFSRLDTCDFSLSLNPNPLCIQFSQLFLFPDGERKKGVSQPSKYLVHPASVGPGVERDEKEEVALARDFLKSVTSRNPIDADIAAGKLPDPEKPGDLTSKRSALVDRGFVSARLDLTDTQLEKAYKSFVGGSRQEHAKPVARAAMSAGVDLRGEDLLNPESRATISKVRELLFPGFFQPYPPAHPKVALVASYEQCWRPVGYTRGDLVNSFALAPGEQLTLEYHYWDKSTVKNEEELAREEELKVSTTLTQRDSTELLSELFSELGTKVDGGVNLTIPIPAGEVPIPVGVDFNTEIAEKVGTKLQSTAQSSSERVVEASNTFKQTHRVRVEVTREVGSETKQTRVIANTNRCHTLHCAYFEVMSNYVVSVRFTGLEPCLLVQFDRPKITRDFVLCHENVLKRVLLDRLFLGGFEAAKKLSAQRFFRLLKKARERAERAGSGAAAGGAGPADAGDTGESRLDRRVAAILRDFTEVREDAEAVLSGLEELDQPDNFGELTSFILDVLEKYRRLLYWAILHLNANAVDALEELQAADSADVPAEEALADFFAAVTSRDYEDNVVVAMVEKGLDALGIPRPIVDVMLLAHKINVVALADDDAGLAASVRAAEEAFAGTLPAPAPVAPPGAAPAVPGQPAEAALAAPAEEGFDLQELAEAHVELQRLLCHIRENEAHYMQAIFQSLHPDQRLEFLRAKGLDATVRNEIVGFLNDHALFPLAEEDLLAKLLKAAAQVRMSASDLEELAEKAGEEIGESDKPRLVTIPTPATVMEAILGDCDGCEDFIRRSRAIELRQTEAKAAQEESEAERRRALLAATPPELGEFTSPSGGRISVTVDGDDEG